jgi:RNA polymerase sigma-70 factor (ECF subfamily)
MSTIAFDAKLISAASGSAVGQMPLTDCSENEVIRLAQEGNAAAFEHIYRLHSRRVHALCLRMTRNPAHAEDLTQDVFLQVFRKIHTFRAESAFSTWLYRLAVNVVLMRRRIKALNETSLDATDKDKEDGNAVRSKEMGRPDLCLAGIPDRMNLKRALEQLPHGYKVVFLLHDVEGYEHHEIAEALGFSIGNSKSQLHKARMRLRTLLQDGRRIKHKRAAEPDATNHQEESSALHAPVGR